MSENGYYVPTTLKEMEKFIHNIIRDMPDLDGNELITDVVYVSDDNYDVPKGTIMFYLKKDWDKPDDSECGRLILMPTKARRLM